MCGWLSFQTEDLFAALRITFFRYAWPTSTNDDTSLYFGLYEVFLRLLGNGNRSIYAIYITWNCNVQIQCYLMLKKATIWC